MTKKRYIIGFGNMLMTDDAVGIQITKELRRTSLPKDIEVVDGGVASYEVLAHIIEQAAELIIVDAMNAGGDPGSIYTIKPTEIDRDVKDKAMSIHDFSLVEALYLLEKEFKLPPTIIFGIEPKEVKLGLELTEEVKITVPKAIDMIVNYAWGKQIFLH